jgi:bifunctional DNase/RNase
MATLARRALLPVALFTVAALLAACRAAPGAAHGGARAERATAAAEPTPPVNDDLLPAEVATVGWDAVSNSPIVLVRELGSGRLVPIWVGAAEAQAIAAALHGVEPPRPMTHDLMSSLLAKLDAKLEEVQIHDLRGGTYYGWLKLRVAQRAEPMLVDTRPSDGLALALRTGAQIRLARKVLDQTPEFDFLAPEAEDQVVRIAGLTVVVATPELRKEFALPERAGVVVSAAAGEAARKGLRRGDLIVEVNGAVPANPLEFLKAVRGAPLKAPMRVRYWRDGKETAVELKPTPAELPAGESEVAA